MAHNKKEMISFFLTTKCNLDCIYCYTNKNSSAHAHQVLDPKFARAGIDDYYKTGLRRHIRFFGAGEPTIEIELMKEILSYAKSKDADTTSEIQTNGCFNEKTAAWIADNIDIVWVSCDGLPKIQDYYRPLADGGRSSGILEKNLKYLIKNAKGMTGIRTTITDKNVSSQVDLIKYYAGFGIKNFWADPVFPEIGSKNSFDSCEMEVFIREFVKAVRYAYKNGMTYGSILTCNFDETGEYACRACLPVPHLTTDGYVSACDMALFGNDADHMNVFIYGKWNQETGVIEYYPDKIRQLRARKLSNMPRCKNCAAGQYCRGYCLGEVVNETGDLFGCKDKICAPVKILLHELTEEEKQYEYFHP